MCIIICYEKIEEHETASSDDPTDPYFIDESCTDIEGFNSSLSFFGISSILLSTSILS